jgi:hypothetical protein
MELRLHPKPCMEHEPPSQNQNCHANDVRVPLKQLLQPFLHTHFNWSTPNPHHTHQPLAPKSPLSTPACHSLASWSISARPLAFMNLSSVGGSYCSITRHTHMHTHAPYTDCYHKTHTRTPTHLPPPLPPKPPPHTHIHTRWTFTVHCTRFPMSAYVLGVAIMKILGASSHSEHSVQTLAPCLPVCLVW